LKLHEERPKKNQFLPYGKGHFFLQFFNLNIQPHKFMYVGMYIIKYDLLYFEWCIPEYKIKNAFKIS